MQTRREVVKQSAAVASMLAATGMGSTAAYAQAGAWPKAAFEAKTMAELTKALGVAAPVESKEVTVQGPDIAENGAVVPLGAASTAAGVKRILLMVEKNPNVLAAAFDVSDAMDASISTRVKMGQSSNVYAVALTGDGKALYAMKEVKVTLGGCGG